ncbi:MAG: EAL domain-containing protein [Lachnospiraceae bacterium]|nr:EAL domain-containing protein [Lachnospiraceae bacterium]
MKNKIESNRAKIKSVRYIPSLKSFKKKGQKVVDNIQQAVLLSINLCNLKYFNEIYGTDEGDYLISKMIDYFIINNDNCVFGTKSYVDHLLVLCEGYNYSKEELIDYYEHFSKDFKEEINAKYPRARINLDVGMYIVQKDEDFIVAQDNARYARRSVADSYETSVAFYTEGLREKSLREASVIPNFQKAIEEHEIIVLLQPKYSVEKNKIVGAEALSRFKDPSGNIVSPALYVPILEKANIIYQLDYEVLRQVINMQKRWQDEGKELFPISVNLSRIDLLEDDIIENIDSLVEASQIPKNTIEFEFTETVLVENLSSVINKLNLLKEKGYRIAIDDFGSGYNSLYVLGQIPANVIKFDRGFVLHSLSNEIGLTIMKNLVETFKEISFEVLCEGVETKEEEANIVACGCDVIQGFLYDRPLAVPDFEAKYVAC